MHAGEEGDQERREELEQRADQELPRPVALASPSMTEARPAAEQHRQQRFLREQILEPDPEKETGEVVQDAVVGLFSIMPVRSRALQAWMLDCSKAAAMPARSCRLQQRFSFARPPSKLASCRRTAGLPSWSCMVSLFVDHCDDLLSSAFDDRLTVSTVGES